MNFKQFLSEEINLNDLGQNMDRVFVNQKFAQHSRDFLSGNSDQLHAALDKVRIPQDQDLEVPKMETTSKVSILLRNRNPIFMKLADGTEASFTYDEWKRIKGEPKLGSTVTMIFQRHKDYQGRDHSKIEQVIVRD